MWLFVLVMNKCSIICMITGCLSHETVFVEGGGHSRSSRGRPHKGVPRESEAVGFWIRAAHDGIHKN